MKISALPTHLWVEAKLKGLSYKNIPAYVLHRGNAAGGLVLVKLVDLKGSARLYFQERRPDGNLGWRAEDKTEKEADSVITAERNFDSDLWVIEVEDQSLSNPFEN